MTIINKTLILALALLISSNSVFAINFLPMNKTVIPASRGYSNAGRINQTVKFLADQLSQNKDFANITDSKLAITSFVNIENLRETNKLGNLISEHLIHDMQIRGYKVIDYKTMPDIEVGKHGDYAFTRTVDNLRQDIALNYILTGTYTFYADGVSLNARIIDTQTSVVVSTAQAFIPREELIHIVDSMSPYQALTSTASDEASMGSGAMESMGEKYLVPGVEGTRIKIRRANF